MKKEHIEQLIIITKDLAERQHPEWPSDIIHAAAVIAEETGELVQACLDLVYFGGTFKDVQDEVISVAAMAERFLEYFPEHYRIVSRYGWNPKFKRKEKDEGNRS